MRLPNPDRIVIDLEKLSGYCLSPVHPRGRHKARVFRASLGLTLEHVFLLVAALRGAAASCDAEPGQADDFGQRYVVDFMMDGPHGSAEVRSCWIVRSGEDFARFVSCYVK